MAARTRVAAALIGEAIALPAAWIARYPELAEARYRRGGIFLRIGGWFVGASSVAGITLWRTVWLARDAPLDPGLLLHEVRHVQQFQASRAFPARYVWESLRRGYNANRFEVDARRYAADRLAGRRAPPPPTGS